LTTVRFDYRPRSEHQSVEPVEGGVLIALCEGGIVEHRIDEVIHAPAVGEDCLSDVDELHGVFPDDVNAEQSAGFAMEE
jgi:hypothetical protein